VIAFLEGQLVEKAPDRVVLAVNGTGYEVLVPTGALGALPPPGRRAKLFTRLQVRDEQMVLYGFASPSERHLFDQLITVTGVGPKLAIAILSVLSPESLRRAIATGDADALVVRVEPTGAACHTGEKTCFFRDLKSAETAIPV